VSYTANTQFMAPYLLRFITQYFTTLLHLNSHVTRVSATCFYWLRQFRRVRRSLDDDAMKTLVHAFVTSRVDYCNAVLAGSPKSTTDTLQRVLNAAARLVTNTHKYTTVACRVYFMTLARRP